jgi:amidophosphoribosyltransferase
MARKLNEECGIFGVACAVNGEAAGLTYNALLALQHRGQESAGIAVIEGNSIICRKDKGYVSEVFTESILSELNESSTAIGHVRYSTTGSNTAKNAQPIVKDYFKGRIAVAHNGNITNAKSLRKKLENQGVLFESSNDSEVISALIACEMLSSGSKITMENAVLNAVKQVEGAYSLIILSDGKVLAVRDACGFRPLCMGKIGKTMVFASESCALDAAGADFIRDIKPGEIVSISKEGTLQSLSFKKDEKQGLCIFELVYFARTDSVIDNVSVYKARFNAGVALAKGYPADADIVCGVPDSGLEAAQGYAYYSGIPLSSAFVKNRYIGRSFIYPSQSQREAAVRIKLNPLRANVEGKRVVLVDDSIVRGTTSAKIIAMLKNAGAKEVHLRISSPPFIHTCHFGTDIDSEEKLIAKKYSKEEIRKKIGADGLEYLSTEELKDACKSCRLDFCTGCFNGDYPLKIDEEHFKNQFE